MKKIGVLGLGIIGQAWARGDAESGVRAGTWNRTPRPGVRAGMSLPESVAEISDVIQIVVADPPGVEVIIERISSQLRPGKAGVQSSPIDPGSSREFGQKGKGRGAWYVGAPFTCSRPAAEARKKVYYPGGESAAIPEVERILQLVSEHCFGSARTRRARSSWR